MFKDIADAAETVLNSLEGLRTTVSKMDDPSATKISDLMQVIVKPGMEKIRAAARRGQHKEWGKLT
jgi:hypothetical protein